MNPPSSAPLAGIRIVEIAGLGPTPFAAMVLADLGADIVRIDRPGGAPLKAGDEKLDILNRGRPSLALDLKRVDAREVALTLIEQADVLLEGLRPGVMERIGLGPQICQARNERLIYARMTGWGQSGPLAAKAGHDINYIAMAGALQPLGSSGEPPPPPLNLVGDFGGGAMLAVTGILAALIARGAHGKGQIVDAAMIDGAALLMSQVHAWRAMGFWSDARSQNLLDGSCYFYRTYLTADDKYLAVGAIEPQFHDAFITGLGLDPAQFPQPLQRSHWRERSELIAAIVRLVSRDEWVRRFAPLDACVSPVLTPMEAAEHPANRERGVFVKSQGLLQPAPAPRFSQTPTHLTTPPSESGADSTAALAAWGFTQPQIQRLIASGAVSVRT